MSKMIEDSILELEKLKNGITKNSDKWTGIPVTLQQIEEKIALLKTVDQEILNSVNLVQQKRQEGRVKLADTEKFIQKARNLALGLHAEEESKLNEYGVLPRKSRGSRTIPGKASIESIIDDYDGVGFIVSIRSLDQADYFEVERGIAPTVDSSVLPLPYPFYCTTRKLKLNDDDVTKGIRYFYRVRGVNNIGSGEWSEPVSRVQ